MYSRRMIYALVLVVALASAAASASGQSEQVAVPVEPLTVTYVDDLGREIAIPASPMRLSPSGNLAQMMIYALCPERMVGLAKPLSANAMEFMLPEIRELPAFGNFFASKGNINREALIMANPDVFIDVGEMKRNMREDFDVLQAQIGIPVVFIEGFLENTGDTLRKLGRLLGLENRAEVLASYADRVVSLVEEKRDGIIGHRRAYYSSSPDGLDGFPSGSFHGEILEFIGLENVVPATFSSGGNRISLEQLILWNPDVMLIQDADAYRTIMSDPRWAALDAVRNGDVHLIPILPYPFLSNPPALNRLIGMLWLGCTCYPELYSDVDLESEMRTFYDLFYHYELPDDEIASILDRN